MRSIMVAGTVVALLVVADARAATTRPRIAHDRLPAATAPECAFFAAMMARWHEAASRDHVTGSITPSQDVGVVRTATGWQDYPARHLTSHDTQTVMLEPPSAVPWDNPPSDDVRLDALRKVDDVRLDSCKNVVARLKTYGWRLVDQESQAAHSYSVSRVAFDQAGGQAAVTLTERHPGYFSQSTLWFQHGQSPEEWTVGGVAGSMVS